MANLLCFKCRAPLDPGSPYCAHCGTTYSASEQDPEAVRNERSFLLACAFDLSDLQEPRFYGYTEEELLWRADRRPTLPLGRPMDPETPVDREELLRRLSSSDAWQRGWAALELAEHDEPETVFSLLRRLGDIDSDVRSCILWALGQAENPLTIAPLLEFARVESDKTVRAQLAATLHRIVTRAGHARGSRGAKPELKEELAAVEAELLVEPTAELFIDRGRLHVRCGWFLKAVGDFSRAVGDDGTPTPKAMLYRSQSFLLMGKPLYALDDLLVCPLEFDYPPVYYLHKAALLTLARQIAEAARDKGLDDYARLFERRLDKLDEKKEK